MGVFVDKKDEQVIEVEGESFILKPLTLGEGNSIMRECSNFDVVSGNFSMDSQKLGEMRLVKMIASWSLKDEVGNVIPITLENIRRLKEDVAGKLLATTRRMTGVPRDLEKGLGVE